MHMKLFCDETYKKKDSVFFTEPLAKYIKKSYDWRSPPIFLIAQKGKFLRQTLRLSFSYILYIMKKQTVWQEIQDGNEVFWIL